MSDAGKWMGFWKYDTYPYLLGGTIVDAEVKQSGKLLITTLEYGPGHRFNPVLVVPESQGLILLDKLQSLEKKRTLALKSVKEVYDREVSDLMDGCLKTVLMKKA
ncbi:MAG: hypothetical protein ACWGQW_03335 [bacterium]